MPKITNLRFFVCLPIPLMSCKPWMCLVSLNSRLLTRSLPIAWHLNGEAGSPMQTFWRQLRAHTTRVSVRQMFARHLRSLEPGLLMSIASLLIRWHPVLGFPCVVMQPFHQHHLWRQWMQSCNSFLLYCSPDDSTGPTLPTSDLQLAIEELHTKLQATHVSFLFDGSAASLADEVQPLKFASVLNTPNLDTSDDDEDSVCSDSKTKAQLQATISHSRMKWGKLRCSPGPCPGLHSLDHTAVFGAHWEQKVASWLIQKGAKVTNCPGMHQPSWKGKCCNFRRVIDNDKQVRERKEAAAARKAGSYAVLELSPEEKDRRCELWKIAEREFKDQRDQLKSDGMPVKYAGKKPLLRWFNEANDPEALLQDIQNLNQAFSCQAPHQTCCQHCKTIIYSEQRNWPTKGQILLVSWIVAQRTKGKSYDKGRHLIICSTKSQKFSYCHWLNMYFTIWFSRWASFFAHCSFSPHQWPCPSGHILNHIYMNLLCYSIWFSL